jgi:outer membrane protein OmpA-like peptidoglycan-associated protein
MRKILPRTLFALLLPAAAMAQVSTDDHALDSLTSTPAPAAPVTAPAPRPAALQKPKPRTRRAARTEAHKTTTTATPARKPPPPLPTAPPANPVIAPPPFVMPAHKPPPPPPVPVRADATGAAQALPGNIERITFGPGSSDLNPATAEAIRQIAAAAIANPALTVTITAWAAGNNDDPSTPRRISLDRALAARAVLINAGVISERIHAVAKGFADPGAGPIDRVDVMTSVPGGPKSP